MGRSAAGRRPTSRTGSGESGGPRSGRPRARSRAGDRSRPRRGRRRGHRCEAPGRLIGWWSRASGAPCCGARYRAADVRVPSGRWTTDRLCRRPSCVRSAYCADGPVVWGRPLPPTGAGVFVVELADPLASAPHRVDPDREVARARAGTCGSTASGRPRERWPRGWRRSGCRRSRSSTSARPETSVSRRVAAMHARRPSAIGGRRPAATGSTPSRCPAGARIWWAADEAVEEYEDALLTAFAERRHRPSERPPSPTRRRPAVREPAPADRRAQGDRADRLAPPRAGRAPRHRPASSRCPTATPKAPTANRPSRSVAGAATTRRAGRDRAAGARAAGSRPPGRPPRRRRPRTPAPTSISAEGAERLQAELDELVTGSRPEVIARIRSAKELGDLKENADYTSAREEQSFLEGRIQAIEARLRTAVIVEPPAAGARIGLGSVVTVEIDGETDATTRSSARPRPTPRPAGSRTSSPVGRALIGRAAGDEVVVRTPGGEIATIVRSTDVATGSHGDRTGGGARRCAAGGASAGAADGRQPFGPSTSLCSTAYSAACVRDASPSLPRMFET